MSSGGQPTRAATPHAVRPTDLVALFTFDGEVYENQAMTRERLARPGAPPRPLNAAIQQWAGRGRRTWLDVRGRQIEGIATARELTSTVWAVDTLIDASPAGDDDVLSALLRQAVEAATRARVTHLLLRTPADAPAGPAALRLGFKPVVAERLWEGARLTASAGAAAPVTVREASIADDVARFQLFNRAVPIEGREALALTLDEWRRTQERRWLGRGARELVALVDDRVFGALRLSTSGGTAQFDLVTDPDGSQAAAALLAAAADQLSGAGRVLALIPECLPALASPLGGGGLEATAAYVLMCRRTTKPLAEKRRGRARMAVPSGG